MFSLFIYQNPFSPFALRNPIMLVACIYPLAIRLSPFEISPPKTVLKVYLCNSFLLIMHIGPFILDPVPFKHLYILLIYLLFSFFYLELTVLNPMSMKEPLVKFPLIPQFLILIVQLPISMHPSIFPIPHIGLSINILVNSLTMSHSFSTLISIPGQCLTHVTTYTTLSGSRVPKTLFCHYLRLPKKRRLLLISDAHVLTIQIHLRLDECSYEIGVLRHYILYFNPRSLVCLYLGFRCVDKGEFHWIGSSNLTRIKSVMQIPKSQPLILMWCQHLLQNINQVI